MEKNYDRMFCYLWFEKSNPNECKFGERWVPVGVNPQESCEQRIKESLGVRKDLWKTGEVILFKIWDVTEYSKTVNRYYKSSRVDDHIREQIGFRKGTTGEIHTLNYEIMAIKVNKLLTKLDQPLPVAGLSTGQYNMVEDTLSMFNEGKNIVLAELCARFGKTLFSGAVASELESPLTIICSYVKTVFTSFEVDMTSFEQFKGIVHINTEDKDYQQQIEKALSESKKVFVYLSLVQGGKRQDRIDYLFNLDTNRFLVIDEADFGAHKPGQSEPLINAVQSNDKVLIMTGTNADKAASTWKVDGMISTTYFELLGHKSLANQK
jgi:hypothetical protein